VNSIELYVKKEIVGYRMHGEFICTLNLDNGLTGFMSPVHNT